MGKIGLYLMFSFLDTAFNAFLISTFICMMSIESHWNPCFQLLKKAKYSTTRIFMTWSTWLCNTLKVNGQSLSFQIWVSSEIWERNKSGLIGNIFHATVFFLDLLKISEKIWFSDIFRGYRKRHEMHCVKWAWIRVFPDPYFFV